MDRTFLYSMVALLALANTTIYIQKTNPSFFADLIPNSQKADSWIKEDPGWTNQDFPKSDNTAPPVAPPVQPKVDPIPPRLEPQPPSQPPQQRPQQRPQQQQPRSNPGCPRCR